MPHNVEATPSTNPVPLVAGVSVGISRSAKLGSRCFLGASVSMSRVSSQEIVSPAAMPKLVAVSRPCPVPLRSWTANACLPIAEKPKMKTNKYTDFVTDGI
jgi:hypothetical protein